MTQQTLKQARIIDPILTTHAQGYARPANVGRFLFPMATVAGYGGQVIEFDKSSFRRFQTRRAPGSATKRVTFGYAGKPYAIVPNGLEAVVPNEVLNDASLVPGFDVAADYVDSTLDVMELAHEYECAEIARNPANYDNDHKMTLVGADRWTGANGDPTRDVVTAREAIRKSIGMRPNTLLLPSSAFNACEYNPKILDRIKYTGRDSVTAELLAKLWNVQNVIVADAIGADGADDELADVWGDDVILAYVAPPSGSNRRSAARPSYGYTYTITGMPLVRKPYLDENANSWIYPVAADRTPVLSGITAGFLIRGAGGPAA